MIPLTSEKHSISYCPWPRQWDPGDAGRERDGEDDMIPLTSCVNSCCPCGPRSEILVMLGENGTGKTTFIRMLHGSLKPDQEDVDLPEFRVSYKPQKISPKFPGSVQRPLLSC